MSNPPTQPAAPAAAMKPRLSFRAIVLLLVIALLLTVAGVELACQAYFYAMVKPGWDELRASTDHFFERSPDPRLGYALRRGYSIDRSDRQLHINTHGIRDETDAVPPPEAHTIAVLGDSVVFGILLSQDQTVTALLQKRLDPSAAAVRILNFGVSGYSLAEFTPFYESLAPTYTPDHVVYVFNPNDFSVRGTVYEGGDNGLYRMYHPPVIKTPWFIRKAIYRGKKGGPQPTGPWYEWLYQGTKDESLPAVLTIRDAAKSRGATFSVYLFPSGNTYTPSGNTLADEFAEIGAWLTAHQIVWSDGTPDFAGSHAQDIDETDHPTAEGNIRFAEALERHLERTGFLPAAPASAPR